MSEAIRHDVKNELGVHNESLNEKYLGLPSDVGRDRKGTFSYLKDRVWKHLLGWMEKTLSGAGKEVLIKSVVQAILIYSMVLFRLPRGLCEQEGRMENGLGSVGFNDHAKI